MIPTNEPGGPSGQRPSVLPRHLGLRVPRANTWRSRLARAALVAAPALLVVDQVILPWFTVYAACIGDFVLVFHVTDADSGAPVPGVDIDLRIDRTGEQRVVRLQAGPDEVATFHAGDMRYDITGRPLRPDHYLFDLTWAYVTVTAPSYARIENRWLHRGDHEHRGRSPEDRCHYLDIALALEKTKEK